jgi:hypothetical protein
MGNILAWLLGIPAGALVLAYLAICASVLGAKRRMAGHEVRARQAAGITVLRVHNRDGIGQAGLMARR